MTDLSSLARFVDEVEAKSSADEHAEAGAWIVEAVDDTVVDSSGLLARTFYGPYDSPITALELVERISAKLAAERRDSSGTDPMSAPLRMSVHPLLPPPAATG